MSNAPGSPTADQPVAVVSPHGSETAGVDTGSGVVVDDHAPRPPETAGTLAEDDGTGQPGASDILTHAADATRTPAARPAVDDEPAHPVVEAEHATTQPPLASVLDTQSIPSDREEAEGHPSTHNHQDTPSSTTPAMLLETGQPYAADGTADPGETEAHVPFEASVARPATPQATPADDMSDEPTTLIGHVPQDEMDDEPTTILAAAHDDMADEPTTILPVHHDDMDEPTTVLHADDHDMDEATHVMATPEPHPSDAVPLAADQMDVGDVTEVRLTVGLDQAGMAHAAPEWFTTRMQDFVAALREDSAGARRPQEDFQALAMTARDMLARLAMQSGPRSASDGFGDDTVLQADQLLANTYIVRSLIARGGVGEIYRTRHRDLKTEHAVKVLLPRFALDPTMLTLMQDEARLLQCVRHEAVVFCQDLLRDADGRPMIVMDYVRGRTLSARLREGHLSMPELIVLAHRLADGLGAIHAAGIVHQDISPDNVILAEDSCAAATIIDFGLARRLGTGRDMHRNLDFAGKFSWSSPEQLSGRPSIVDARSDLYSLGLMLAAAARGYRLDMGNDLESARATRTTVPSLAGIDQPIAGLLEALLAPSPGARLGSAAEVSAMLAPKKPSLWQRLLGLVQGRVAV